MSYEPTLIVSWNDLQTNKNEITSRVYKTKWSEAAEFLEKHLNYTPVQVKGTNIILLKPELTSFNKKVRELLRDLDIDFGTDY